MSPLKKELDVATAELVAAKTKFEMFEVEYVQKEVEMAGSKLYQQARNAEERNRTMIALMSDKELHGEDLYRLRAELKLESTLAYYKWTSLKVKIEN